MLYEFLSANRAEVLLRARNRLAARCAPTPTEWELSAGLPSFLEQLGEALRIATSTEPIEHDSFGASASAHGLDLLHRGFTVGQVVHDYGDLFQVITELAVEGNMPISTEEFRALHQCLDHAIARAVTEYSREKERSIRDERAERLGFLADEVGRLLGAAILSFESIRKGNVATGGSTSRILGRSLLGLRSLVDRSFADLRLDAGVTTVESVSVGPLIEELEIAACMRAQAREVRFTVVPVEPSVAVLADRQVLAAAVANLLQNAFDFTPRNGNVALTALASSKRVLIEVADECGGVLKGDVEDLLRLPRDFRRSGLRPGLVVCFEAVKASGGKLRARNIVGKGCVFSVDLPQSCPPP